MIKTLKVIFLLIFTAVICTTFVTLSGNPQWTARPLLTGSNVDTSPNWSADGTQIIYHNVRAGYETYSDFGFSFEYPEGMEVNERMLKMIKSEEGALLYMSPLNNDNAGAVSGYLEKDAKLVELIDIQWRQMEPITLTKEDADKFFALGGDIRRGEFGEREFAGYSMIYQYYTIDYTIDFKKVTYNGIWSSWYCETSQRKYECFVETIEEDINPIFNRYLKSLLCHQPGYDYSTHMTYSKFDISFEYLKDYHDLEEMGRDESGEIVTDADFNFGMVYYQLRYPNEELECGYRNVLWTLLWHKLEEPIYVIEEDVDWYFDWEGHTFERGELVETTTKTGHRMLYQEYVLTAFWDVSTGASFLYEDETVRGVYGLWYCDDSQREIWLYLSVSTEEDPVTIFEDFLETFSCHERAPKGSLKIIVQDENENPISGATVSSTSKPNGQEAIGGTCGSDGLVTSVDVSIGDYTIKASKSGYETSSESVTVIEDETITLTIQLKEQAGSLKIIVQDEEGNPISGSSVTSTSQPSGQSSLSGTTGSDGSLKFIDVNSGSYTFQASKSEYVTDTESLSVTKGETTEITITLEEEARAREAIQLTEIYSRFGFSFKYPKGMVLSEQGVLEATATDSSGAVAGELKDHVIAVSWIKTLQYDLESAIEGGLTGTEGTEGVSNFVRGDRGESTMKGHNVIYRFYTATIGGEKTNCIISAWYCDDSTKMYIISALSYEAGPEVFPLFEVYLESFYCHEVAKMPSSISSSISPSKVKVGETTDVSGSITPARGEVTVTLTYQKPDGSTFTRTVVTDSDGSYSDSYEPTETGSWNVEASWEGDLGYEGTSSQQIAFTVEEKKVTEEEKKGCIVATATYGSELSPEVQFLRGFRDNTVLNTFAGSSFMTVFNAWYYSFSPMVVSAIAANEALRGFMKILLYPLIGILHLAATTYSLLSFNQELAVVMSGLVTSLLIGIIYFSPFTIISLITMRRLRRTWGKTRLLRLFVVSWLTSVILLLLGEISAFPNVMMVASVMFVLINLSTSAIMTAIVVLRGFSFLQLSS